MLSPLRGSYDQPKTSVVRGYASRVEPTTGQASSGTQGNNIEGRQRLQSPGHPAEASWMPAGYCIHYIDHLSRDAGASRQESPLARGGCLGSPTTRRSSALRMATDPEEAGQALGAASAADWGGTLMRRRFLQPAIRLAIFFALLSPLLLGDITRAGILQTLPITGYAYGIDGFNVVGEAGGFGFLYNGSTYSTIRPPGATSSEAFDVAGNRIVGTYADATGRHGFLFDGATYTTLNNPLAVKGTIAAGLDGNNIVGWYLDAKNRPHGFLFDGTTYTNIDSPLGLFGTQLWGISGNNIVGNYVGSFSITNGFVYSGGVFTELTSPWGETYPYDAEGAKVVGRQGSAGFIYDGSQYTQPLGNGALPGLNNQSFTFTGISGNRLVGFYTDLPPVSLPHPFIYVIPEPTTRVLMVIGFVVLAGVVLRRYCQQPPAIGARLREAAIDLDTPRSRRRTDERP